jgi:glycosyltransferase involved in cell wall biosynthesis
LEAAAMQVPVICSDGVGNTSLIVQKKSGLIFPAGNVSVLKEAIEFAFVKRDFMAACAEQLAQEVEKHFDRKFFHAQLLENYERVLQRG